MRRVGAWMRGKIMKGSIDFAGSEIDDHDYDHWLGTLSEASSRLDALQTAVAEVRCLCEGHSASSEQILKVLDRLAV